MQCQWKPQLSASVVCVAWVPSGPPWSCSEALFDAGYFLGEWFARKSLYNQSYSKLWCRSRSCSQLLSNESSNQLFNSSCSQLHQLQSVMRLVFQRCGRSLTRRRLRSIVSSAYETVFSSESQ